MPAKRAPGLVLGLAILAFAAPAARADSVPVPPRAVVELFTSQGCAQCPPADALLTSLAERGDVVALAYHVDYWDYIGWQDTFGDQAFSDRQRAYAKSWGSSRIYTPQMVINGLRGVVGSKRNEVYRALQGASMPLGIDITREGDAVRISIGAHDGLGDAVVWMVSYRGRADVAIETGENAGKSLVYTQVVTGRQALGMWEAETGADLKLPIAEILPQPGAGIAIVVQQERQGMPGPILGAASFEL